MSKTKIIEGVEYVEKSHVDDIVRQRLSKYVDKNQELEARLTEYQSKIDESQSKIGLVDTLQNQIESLKGELTQANSRYDRHSTIANYGITDNDIRDAVEWAFDRSMNGRAKKDQVTLGDWLKEIKENPESAPTVIRPYFENKTQEPSPAVQSVQEPSPAAQNPFMTAQNPSPAIKPPSNKGVQSQSQNIPAPDLLQRAADPSFYAQNREAIKEAFYRSKGNSTSPFKF